MGGRRAQCFDLCATQANGDGRFNRGSVFKLHDGNFCVRIAVKFTAQRVKLSGRFAGFPFFDGHKDFAVARVVFARDVVVINLRIAAPDIFHPPGNPGEGRDDCRNVAHRTVGCAHAAAFGCFDAHHEIG